MPNALPIEETDPPHALPRGTLLNHKFRLQRVIGVGGFGIVYLAHDEMSDVDVAIKEYMPLSLAGRTRTMQVSLTSQSNAETFALGLKSFWNEARLLARFRDEQLPLLKVYDAFQANGTAYMVMPVLRGRTAYQVRREMPKPPNERWLRTLLVDLLPALERLHAENVYHRDIAPDNIQLDVHAKPVLMDLGAARHVISNRTQSITAILKPGYAPIEQYGENDSLRQGPWTDLYALGATLHFMLLNKAPPSATSRLFDTGEPLARQDLPGCSPAFLRVIDWMLAVRPEDRPQDVAQLRKALEGSNLVPRTLLPKPAPMPVPRAGLQGSTPLRAAASEDDAITVVATPQVANAAHAAVGDEGVAAVEPTRTVPSPGRRSLMPVSVPLMLAGVAALLLVVGTATWLWPRQPAANALAARQAPAVALDKAAPEGPAAALPKALPAAPVTTATAPTPPIGTPMTPQETGAAPTPVAAATSPAGPTVLAARAPATTNEAPTHPSAAPTKRATLAAAPPPVAKKGPVNDKDGALLPKPAEAAPVVDATPPPAPPPPAPAPPPVAPVAAPAAPAVASPSERCSDKDGFARTLCVSLVCGAPALHDHPQCVAIRRR